MSKRLRNISGVDQQIVYKGKQLVLGADSELEMDDEVATAFLSKCEGLVQECVEIGGVFEDIKEDVIWIANMTGDPDAPATVKQKALVAKGTWGTVDVPNPMKAARTIRRTMGGEMREQMGKSGLEGLNCFGVVIEVPPYQRRKLPRHVAYWFIQRNSYSTPGAIIKSRPKSPEEPDLKWELDDLRLYLQLIDPTVTGPDLGPSMKRLRANNDKRRDKKDEGFRRDIRQAKELLMKRLHKRLADPRYRLPTFEEFTEYKAANVEVEEGAAPGANTENSTPASPAA